jgi:hypothetical protein
MGDAEHMKVCALGQGPLVIDRAGNQGIMIAWQQDDRHRRGRNYASGTIQQIIRQSVAIECVAGKHHYVGVEALSRTQYGRESRRAVAAMQPRRVVMIHVQIGAVNDNNIPIHVTCLQTYRLICRWHSKRIHFDRARSVLVPTNRNGLHRFPEAWVISLPSLGNYRLFIVAYRGSVHELQCAISNKCRRLLADGSNGAERLR